MKPNFTKDSGLIPVIAQDATTNTVLMLAYMNELAWEKSLATGKAHYWSRSRNVLWFKGETSGNVQIIKEIFIDCDEDTILLKVEQIGKAACHTGRISCFYRKINGDRVEIVSEQIFDPKEVYK